MLDKLKIKTINLLGKFYKQASINNDSKITLGLNKDVDDERDYVVGSFTYSLPDEHYLPIVEKEFVRNQGNYGSCAAHTICNAIQIEDTILKNNKNILLSPRFHYYYAREHEGTLPNNVGMSMRTMCKIANKKGISPELLCPYIEEDINKMPDLFANGFANWWKISSYFRVLTLEEMKSILYSNKPILVGIYCNQTVMSMTGPIFVTSNDRIYGGHAIVCVGYNNANQTMRFINSWGFNYKNEGSMNIPYDYLFNKNGTNKYLMDAWIINR